MIASLMVITLGIVLWSLWLRRHTWKVKWETASTTQLVCTAVSCLLSGYTFWVGKPVDYGLHYITHLWNLEYWLADIFVLAATCAIVYNAVSRLDRPSLRHPEQSFKCWFTLWIQVPTAIGALVMTVLFCVSKATRDRHPHLADRQFAEYHLLNAYWIAFSLLLLYLLTHGIRAFIDLWDEPGRGLLRLYLIGCGTAVVTVVMRLVTVFFWTRELDSFMDVMGLISIAIFAIATGWSWLKRIRWFTHPTSPDIEHTPDRDTRCDQGYID